MAVEAASLSPAECPCHLSNPDGKWRKHGQGGGGGASQVGLRSLKVWFRL